MKQATDKKRYTDGTKMLWHMGRVIRNIDKERRVSPIHIDAGLTKKCNERCVYCYGFFQNMDGSVIGRNALLKNFVEPAARIGVKSIGYIGDGEPTLNPAYYDALRLGKKLGLSQSTSTNGILIDNDNKRAAILENCEWMRFNISAFSKEGFEQIHKTNKRETVLKNIEDLVNMRDKLNYKCDIGLQMVFVPTMMLDEVIPLSQFAIDTGVDYFTIKQCSIPDSGETGIVQFDLDEYDNPKVRELLLEAQSMSTAHTDIVPKWNIINLKGEKNYDHCVGVQFLPELSGDGGLYPCAYFFGGRSPEYCYGNIHEKPLDDIIHSERYWDIVRHMNEKFDPHTECKGCCRQDATNEFVWEYMHPPQGRNFI